MNLKEMFEILRELDFPTDEYVVTGSAPLLLHRIRESISDIDIVVSDRVWRLLAETSEVEPGPYDGAQVIKLHGGRVEIFNKWFPLTMKWKKSDLLHNEIEIVNGFRFMSPHRTGEWKKKLNREKDQHDLELMEKSGSL